MRSLVASSLAYRFVVVVAAAALMVLGALQLRGMPVDVFPETDPPIVEVQTEAPGLSAPEVEALISHNLEELLSGVPWLRTIRSTSVPGLSSVLLVFEPGTDVMRARQLVQERLALAYTLPNVSKPPVMLQPLSSTSRVMMIGLTPRELDLMEMSVLTRWKITPRLLGVPGVANVAVWGQRDRQLQVFIDPERLRARDVSQEQVIRTTGDALWVSPLTFLNASVPGSGGWIDGPNQRLGIRHILPISSHMDLRRVSVDGVPLRLGDVATVVEGSPPLIGDAVVNGGPGLLLVIEKFPGANTLEVTRGIEAAIAELRPGLAGMELDTTVFRSAGFIDAAIENLGRALLVGALLMMLVLALFLGWRTALISLVAIPLSLLAALLALNLSGATVNSMVLAGLVIALGTVIDDTVTDVENITRRLRQHRREGGTRSTAAIILEASLEVRRPIVYATLIIVLAVTPVFLIGGPVGAFVQPLALSFAVALVASMVVALTVTPALIEDPLVRGAILRPRSRLVRGLLRGYGPVLARTVRAPAAALVLCGIVLLAGAVAAPRLGQSLLPSFQERDLLVEMAAASGTSQPEMSRIMTRVARELRSIPGVRNVGAHVGRAVTGDQVVDINSSQLWVSIDPTAPYARTLASIQETVGGYPGLTGAVRPYLTERIRELLTGSPQAVTVRIYGPQLEALRRKAEEVRQALVGIEGLVDLRVEGQSVEPQVEIQVDLAKAEPYGLKPGDIRRAAATVFAGINAGSLFEQQKVFDVVVWGDPTARHSLTSARELLIEAPAGGHVRLGDIAEISIKPVPTVIEHEAASPRTDIVGSVRGRDVASVAAEIDRRLRGITFPLEYHAELSGEYAERQAAQTRVLQFAVAALIAIFLLLQACFGSWRLAMLAFLAFPAALVGGVLAAAGTGGVLSFGSIVGLLAVLGIAARSAIVLIRHYQRLERDEGEAFGPALVVRGARERLTPILATALATAAALLPLLLAGDIAGLEIVRPMAIVIVGGLITSTLLAVFVVPALYLRVAAPADAPVQAPADARLLSAVEALAPAPAVGPRSIGSHRRARRRT